MYIFVFSKTPSGDLDYTVDWEEWLDTDTIISSTWTVPTGITKDSDSFDATSATIWVSGGDSGENYDLLNTIVTASGRAESRTITLLIREVANIRYLIPELRLTIGDTDLENARYLDTWLEVALLLSVKTLSKWMNGKYLVSENKSVYRNPNGSFIFPEPPIIEMTDERSFLLMAAIIVLQGSLENSAWDYASWRDAEISYTNQESSRARQETVKRLWNELLDTIRPPTKRLAKALKNSLPGYLGNTFEIGDMRY